MAGRAPLTLKDEIRAKAHELGLHRVGVARAEVLELDHARYEAFVDAGFHGEMAYLAEHRAVRRRVDGPEILEGARSVVVCVLAYHRRDEDASGRGPRGARVARYARGKDYHNVFRRKLRKLAAWLRERVPGSNARPLLDTAPVLERAWAQRAGVGFVGKNGCVIAPGLGSFVLLGEVATTIEIEPDEPLQTRCGSCTLCLEACPTGAFVRPFVLDARRCVSYLTIEHKSAIPAALREGVGDRLFGCDGCLDVCPYNRTAPPSSGTDAFASDPRWVAMDIADVLALDEQGFATLTTGSPLSRPGRAGLARNAAIVMGNTGDPRYLPALRAATEHDPAEIVREAARWAMERIETSVAPTAATAPKTSENAPQAIQSSLPSTCREKG